MHSVAKRTRGRGGLLVAGLATKANCDGRAKRVANGNKPILRRNTHLAPTAGDPFPPSPFPALVLALLCRFSWLRERRPIAGVRRWGRCDPLMTRHGSSRLTGFSAIVCYTTLCVLCTMLARTFRHRWCVLLDQVNPGSQTAAQYPRFRYSCDSL